MKQCSRCKEWKEEVEYGKLKSSKDGLNCWCKSCRKIYYQSDAFKETIKKYQQSDAYKESQKKYRQSNAGIESQKKYARSDFAKESRKKRSQSDAYKEFQKKYQQSSTYKECKSLYHIIKSYNIPKEFIPQEVKDLIKIKVENLKQLKQLKNETK